MQWRGRWPRLQHLRSFLYRVDGKDRRRRNPQERRCSLGFGHHRGSRFYRPIRGFHQRSKATGRGQKGTRAAGRHPGEGRCYRGSKCNHRCRGYHWTVCNGRSGHGRPAGRARAGPGCWQPRTSCRLCLHLRRSARCGFPLRCAAASRFGRRSCGSPGVVRCAGF